MSFLLDKRTDLQFTTAARPHHSLKSETLPTYRARSPYLYPLGTGWSSYTSGKSINSDSAIKVLHIYMAVDQGVTQMVILCAQD
jgi:hypothetical protein